MGSKELIPLDLKRALSLNQIAARNFERFDETSRQIILRWIESAKRPDARARRIEETTRLAALGLKANH